MSLYLFHGSSGGHCHGHGHCFSHGQQQDNDLMIENKSAHKCSGHHKHKNNDHSHSKCKSKAHQDHSHHKSDPNCKSNTHHHHENHKSEHNCKSNTHQHHNHHNSNHKYQLSKHIHEDNCVQYQKNQIQKCNHNHSQHDHNENHTHHFHHKSTCTKHKTHTTCDKTVHSDRLNQDIFIVTKNKDHSHKNHTPVTKMQKRSPKRLESNEKTQKRRENKQIASQNLHKSSHICKNHSHREGNKKKHNYESVIPKIISPLPVSNSPGCVNDLTGNPNGLKILKSGALNCSESGCNKPKDNSCMNKNACKEKKHCGLKKFERNYNPHFNISEDMINNGGLKYKKKANVNLFNNHNCAESQETQDKLDISDCIHKLSLSGSVIDDEILEHKDLASHNTRQASRIPDVSIQDVADAAHYEIKSKNKFLNEKFLEKK